MIGLRRAGWLLALLSPLAACDYSVSPEPMVTPRESAPVPTLAPAPMLRSSSGASLNLGSLALNGSGVLEVWPGPLCDVARAVFADALQVPYSCAGGGVLGLVHPSTDPASLVALFVRSVESMGGRVEIADGSVAVFGPGEGEAVGVEGAPLDGFAALDGLDGFVVDDASSFGEVRDVAVYHRKGLVRPVRDGADRANVDALAQELGLDLRVVEFGGHTFVVGDELSLSTFDSFAGLSQRAVVPVAASGLSQVAVDAYASAFPGVSFGLDGDTGMLYLGGLPNDVAPAVAALRSVQPSASRVRIEGLFFSYSTGDLRSLESSLNVAAAPFDLSGDQLGLTNTGTIGLPFELVVRQVEQADFVQVVARPAVTATFGAPSEFHSGGEVPVVAGVDPETGAESVVYRQVGLTTRFTARPLQGDVVRLTLDIELSSVEGSGVRDNPSFDVRSVQTTVDLRRGDTVLLSGLAEMERAASRGRSFGLPSRAGRRSDRSLGLFVTLH